MRRVLVCFLALTAASSFAQNRPVIHWINDSSVEAGNALNNTGTFTTSFRTTNDVTITRGSASVAGSIVENFGSNPGNNPGYITSFVGASNNGTGDTSPGHIGFLDMMTGATGSLQFDFTQPITSVERLLFADIDNNEKYQIQAFALVSGNYVQLSLAGWTQETFSGATGVTPDSTWATWDGSTGTFTATGNSLNEPLNVLTPDQPFDRLIITKLNGAGFSTAFQIISVPEPSTLALFVLALLVTISRPRRHQASDDAEL